MFSISGKEKDDDDATPEPGTPYKIMTKHDEFVDHIEISGLRKRNVAKAVDGQETLLERVGLETGTSSKELKRMKSAFDKFLRNSNPIQRSQDDEADDDDAIDVVPMLEQLMNLEFPTKNQVPTPSQLIPKLGNLLSNRSVYHPGDWVEIEGLDMKWRLDMITRVIKTAPDDYDWNDPENKSEPSWTFTYNAGAERDVDAYDLRAPETGLKIIFGSRPWVWQQYALLKLEAKLRFQEGHQDDFFELDIQKYASELWDEWLEAPANADFRKVYYDERIGEKGRHLLINHIQKPFNLIDTMGEENKEWDFVQDDNINVFTYVSLFGSGSLLALLVLAVQITIPIILLMEVRVKIAEYQCVAGAELSADVYLAKIMSLAVFTYYMFSVIPNTYTNFFNVAGAADTVYSRLLSLRRELWLQGDDTLLQMIGYKLDIYLNTSYETLLSMLNIYVILYEEAAIEIILNALAFAFIARIDEDITKTDFYDPKRRWCCAGAINVVIQTRLRLHYLRSPQLFSKHFDIPEEILLKACDGDSSILHNKGLARNDHKNPNFMQSEEKIEHMCATMAQKHGNKKALLEYKKPVVYFGLLEKCFGRCFGINPIFERYACYRTWSRWQKVLFLSPVPNLDNVFETDDLDNVFETDDNGNVSVSMALNKQLIDEDSNTSISKKASCLKNFYPDEDDISPWVLFLRHFRDVLIFREFGRAIKNAGFFSSLFRIVDGIFFNWVSYFIHIIFPLYLLSAFGETLYNLVTHKCVHLLLAAENYIAGWISNNVE